MNPIRIEEPYLKTPNFKAAIPYMTPRRFHFEKYHTQDIKHTLFRAMRNCIRSQAYQSIVTMGCESEYEVGSGYEYVFITDSKFAKKAQDILIKHQPKNPNKYFDYYRDCKKLEKIA